MSDQLHLEALQFEQEVRRVIRLLYPEAAGGSDISEGRERDGVFISEENVVIVEATVSHDKSKAESDARKIANHAKQLAARYPYKAVKGFFVTKDEPTAHQVDAVRRVGQPVVAMGFEQLRARLVDSREYITLRFKHKFGSARDPETGADILLDNEYEPLDFVDSVQRHREYTVSDLLAMLRDGKRVVLVGEFGAGKSMTLREMFRKITSEHLRKPGTKFAIHLNMNEHNSQTEPAEALERHARIIGYPNPHQLVRAWRAGDVDLVLDGFDEVFVPGWANVSRSLLEIRRRSVELIKNFVSETPLKAGIIIAGRKHFFNDMDELQSALGLTTGAVIASATDFTEAQVQNYLTRRMWKTDLPPWLPRRPLIVGYLASNRVLGDLGDDEVDDLGAGWDAIISSLCLREARLDVFLDQSGVRRIVERLATLARRTSSGLGPLSFEDHVEVFRDLQGYLPDERAYIVLQRLPGLRVSDSHTNTREFIDDDMVDAARAGDVMRWVLECQRGDIPEHLSNWQALMGSTGEAVLLRQMDAFGVNLKSLDTALQRTGARADLEGLRGDLVKTMLATGLAPSRPVTLANLHISNLVISGECDASPVRLDQCIIDCLQLTDASDVALMPSLVDCSVGEVVGVSAIDDFARTKFPNTQFGEFSTMTDNAASILRLDLPDYALVAMTVLKKVFMQAGHSRKDSAFYRGGLTTRQRELVPKVLADLQSRGAIRMLRLRGDTQWVANRALSQRVKKILESPLSTDDPLVSE